jgi:hypothetical protein
VGLCKGAILVELNLVLQWSILNLSQFMLFFAVLKYLEVEPEYPFLSPSPFRISFAHIPVSISR